MALDPRWYSWIGEPLRERLRARFTLTTTPLDPNADMVLAQIVHPVTDVDSLMRVGESVQLAKDISVGGAYDAYWTVPSGKRWRFHFVLREGTTGASTVVISRSASGNSALVSLSGTSAERLDMCGTVLDEGDSIGMTHTGNGADTSIWMQIHYQEEDAYAI